MLRCRSFVLPLALLGVLTIANRELMAGGEIIPETTAARYGLTLAWFNQIQLDPARGRVQHVVLDEGMLLVTTNRAMLHAMDAETGKTLWVEPVGRAEHPTYAPAANKQLVAVVNGSNVYLLQREDGRLVRKIQATSVPGAGPGLSEQRVYLPMLSGMVQSYRLASPADEQEEDDAEATDKKKLSAKELGEREAKRRNETRIDVPLSCKSWGQALTAPFVIRQNEDEERAAWPTDRGFLFVSQVLRGSHEQMSMCYHLETSGGIVGKPAYLPPDPTATDDTGSIFVTSRDGFIHALREKDGSALWRFPTSEPMVTPAVAIDGRVYATIQMGGLYCLDAQKGEQLWYTPQVTEIVSVSKNRVYAADKLGQVQILDARNGARLQTLPTQSLPVKLTNTSTDRLYLASTDGLIQCLREIDLAGPIRHNVAPKIKAADKAEPKPAKKPVAESADEDTEASEEQ